MIVITLPSKGGTALFALLTLKHKSKSKIKVAQHWQCQMADKAPHLNIDESNLINGGKALDCVNAGSLNVQNHIADLGSCMQWAHTLSPHVYDVTIGHILWQRLSASCVPPC